MKIQKIALFFLSICFTSVSYASYQQIVQTCLHIENNDTPYKFRVGFVSHDFFDAWKFSQVIFNGSTCAVHTYKAGPKSIKLKVTMSSTILDGNNLQENIIVLDNSCTFLMNKYNAAVETPDYLRTGNAHEYWDFTLTKLPSQPSYHYAYGLKCKHWAN